MQVGSHLASLAYISQTSSYINSCFTYLLTYLLDDAVRNSTLLVLLFDLLQEIITLTAIGEPIATSQMKHN